MVNKNTASIYIYIDRVRRNFNRFSFISKLKICPIPIRSATLVFVQTVTGPDSGTEEDVGSSFVIVQKPEEMTDKDKVQELSYAGDGLDVVIPVPVLKKEDKPVEQQKQVGFEFI